MLKIKFAEFRSLRKMRGSQVEAEHDRPKKRFSLLSIFKSVMGFVVLVRHVLTVIDKIYDWCKDLF